MAIRAASLFVISSLFLSVPAFARDGGCQKRSGAVCATGDVGRVAPVGGDANLSRGGDFTPIKTEARLRAGDRVLLGAKGARLELGNSCATDLAPGSLATITRQGDLICASEFEKTPPGVRELGDNDKKRPVASFDEAGATTSLAAIALIGAGIGIAIHQGNEKPPTHVSAQ